MAFSNKNTDKIMDMLLTAAHGNIDLVEEAISKALEVKQDSSAQSGALTVTEILEFIPGKQNAA